MSALDPAQRRRRGWATGVVLTLVLVANVAGKSDHFPFTPFSQYSGSVDPNSTFTVLSVHVTTTEFASKSVPFSEFGLRRAEVENELNRLGRDPVAIASNLAQSYAHFHPDGPQLIDLDLVVTLYVFENGSPAGSSSSVIASSGPV